MNKIYFICLILQTNIVAIVIIVALKQKKTAPAPLSHNDTQILLQAIMCALNLM